MTDEEREEVLKELNRIEKWIPYSSNHRGDRALGTAIAWSKTPQGFDYWSALYMKLYK